MNGLTINGGTSTIRALILNRFKGSGIVVQSNSNLVKGNFIGTNAAGRRASANNVDGIKIIGGATGNTVGGTAAADANLISGNKRFGLYLSGAVTTGNTIQGNTIGLNLAKTAKVANGVGVWIAGGAHTNLVGGTVAGSPNAISGNTGSGVVINGTGSNANQVFGNFIGTISTSAAGLGNGGDGVTIGLGADNSAIGEKVALGGNVICGNGIHGAQRSQRGN